MAEKTSKEKKMEGRPKAKTDSDYANKMLYNVIKIEPADFVMQIQDTNFQKREVTMVVERDLATNALNLSVVRRYTDPLQTPRWDDSDPWHEEELSV